MLSKAIERRRTAGNDCRVKPSSCAKRQHAKKNKKETSNLAALELPLNPFHRFRQTGTAVLCFVGVACYFLSVWEVFYTLHFDGRAWLVKKKTINVLFNASHLREARNRWVGMVTVRRHLACQSWCHTTRSSGCKSVATSRNFLRKPIRHKCRLS